MLAQNTFKEIHIHVCATRDKPTIHISEFLAWQQGRLYIPPTGRQNRFFVAHDKRYEVFLSSGENTDSANLRHKEIVCLWNKRDFLVGQIKRMTTIPTRGKMPIHYLIGKYRKRTILD